MTWNIYQEPALEFLSRFPDRSVDLIITDPAYESLERHRATGTTTRLSGEGAWFPTIPNAQYLDLAREWRRVLKRTGSIFLFGDATTQFDVANPTMIAAGWDVHAGGSTQLRKVIAWDKMNMGMGYGFREQVELILFWRKSAKATSVDQDRSVRNFFTSDASAGQAMRVKGVRGKGSYPTEKPVEGLLDVFVRQASSPGDLVIDCFAGSGSTGEAALSQGRRFLGCDVLERAVDRTRARLSAFAPSTEQIPRIGADRLANQAALF